MFEILIQIIEINLIKNRAWKRRGFKMRKKPFVVRGGGRKGAAVTYLLKFKAIKFERRRKDIKIDFLKVVSSKLL